MKVLERGDGLLIVCSLKMEAEALKRHCTGDLEIHYSGLGIKRTTRRLERFNRDKRPQLIIFTGTAGQLDPSLELGQIVLPRQWMFEDGRSYPVDPVLTRKLLQSDWEISGTGLTVRRPVLRKSTRLRLFQGTGARLCDMESAAAMKLAAHHGVLCLAPRVISDTSTSGLAGFYRSFDASLVALASYIEKLLKRLEEIGMDRFGKGS